MGFQNNTAASGAPTGNAGGDLGSTYPNPTVTGLTHAALTWTAYTPTWTGFSADPSLNFARYAQVGKLVIVAISCSAQGTSNATTLTVTGPVNAKNNFNLLGGMLAADNGSLLTAPAIGSTRTNSNVIDCYKDGTFGGNAWTASSTKYWHGTFIYEAA